MTQIIYPDGDVSASNWTGTYDDINDVSDAEYIIGSNTANGTFICTLENPSPPASSTCTIRFRARKDLAGGFERQVSVQVFEGTTARGSAISSGNLTETFTEYSGSTNLSSVSDWTALRFNIVSTGDVGTPAGNRRYIHLSSARLETPDGAIIIYPLCGVATIAGPITDIVPGAVTKSMQVGVISTDGPRASIELGGASAVTIYADTGLLQASSPVLSINAPVTISALTGQATAEGPRATISAGAVQPVTIYASTGQATSSGPTPVISSGTTPPTTIYMDTGVATASGPITDIVTGAVVVQLGIGAALSSGPQATIRALGTTSGAALLIDRPACGLQISDKLSDSY